MSTLRQLKEKVRRGEDLPFPWAMLLSAGTPVTRLGMAWRLRGPRVRVAAWVISYGNLTVGGTGKTPAVIARARQEVGAGKVVAVLTRGYGGMREPEPVIIAPGGYRPGLAPADWRRARTDRAQCAGGRIG